MLDTRKVAKYNETDSSTLLMQENGYYSRKACTSLCHGFNSIMMVTTVEEERAKVRWGQMLNDARLEDMRIWRERSQRNVVLMPSLLWRGTRILECDGLVLGHGSAELRLYRVGSIRDEQVRTLKMWS